MLSRFIKSAGTKETHAFIEPHESRQNRTAHKMVIPDHYKTDAHCDTERDKQCVQHADRTGNIVLVSNIADAIRKRHTGNQWDDGTDDNLTQMMSKSQLIDQDGDESHKHATGYIRCDFGKLSFHHAQQIDIQQQSGDKSHDTVYRIAAEEITEASAAHAGSKDLAEIPLGGHLLDILKLLIGFLRCIESVFNLTGELVDRSDTVKPGSTQRDVAYPGKVLIRVAVSREKETTA